MVGVQRTPTPWWVLGAAQPLTVVGVQAPETAQHAPRSAVQGLVGEQVVLPLRKVWVAPVRPAGIVSEQVPVAEQHARS